MAEWKAGWGEAWEVACTEAQKASVATACTRDSAWKVGCAEVPQAASAELLAADPLAASAALRGYSQDSEWEAAWVVKWEAVCLEVQAVSAAHQVVALVNLTAAFTME